VLRAMNSSLDLPTALATIIARAVRLSEADEGMIYGYWLGRSAQGRRLVAVDDVQRGPALARAGGDPRRPGVPLLKEDKVIGGGGIRQRPEGAFRPTTVTLMQTFAAQCVLAIENARLSQKADRARESAESALVRLRNAQDSLVQTEKVASLGQPTAGIAHEIKNPLNLINNFSALSIYLSGELDAAVHGDLPDEINQLTTTLKGNLAKIAEHRRRADSIVRNMLPHSRGGRGEQRSVDVNGLTEEAPSLSYHERGPKRPGSPSRSRRTSMRRPAVQNCSRKS
jgi:signal transduction histidine kinase